MSKIHASCIACFLAMGCQDESWKDDYTFVWHGEYVSVYGYDRSIEEACGGSFAAIDTHTEAILEMFGSDEPIHYDYRWMSAEFFEGRSRCPSNGGACTMYGEPWATSVPQMHEIAHAVEYLAWDNACPSLLGEGLAEYFSGPRFHGDEVPDPSLIWGLMGDLTEHRVTGADYTVAGHFASFLVEEFGFQAIEDLCRAIPIYSIFDQDDWEVAVENVLGLTLDELLAMYENYPLCTQQQYAARAWECAGEPDVVYTGEKTTFYVETDCASQRVMGPMGGKALTTRRVWIPEDGYVVITHVQTDPPGHLRSFMTQECVPCSAEPQVFRADGLPPIYPFRAGMHEFIFSFDLDQTEPLEMRLDPPVGP
jgi:hypothetical protein